MLIDPPQPDHSHALAEFVQDTHSGHLGLAAQPGEFPPRALLRQQLDQQVHRMDWCQQAQQMNPIKLGGAVSSPSPAGGARRPAFVDEIVGHERVQKLKQGRRAGRWKVGIHVPSLPPNI